MNNIFHANHLYYLPRYLRLAAWLGRRHQVAFTYLPEVTYEEEAVPVEAAEVS